MTRSVCCVVVRCKIFFKTGATQEASRITFYVCYARYTEGAKLIRLTEIENASRPFAAIDHVGNFLIATRFWWASEPDIP